jgi:hypothetical protein
MFSLARWVFGTLIAAIIFSLGRSGEEAEGEEVAQRPGGRNNYVSRALQIGEPSPEAGHARLLGLFLRALLGRLFFRPI